MVQLVTNGHCYCAFLIVDQRSEFRHILIRTFYMSVNVVNLREIFNVKTIGKSLLVLLFAGLVSAQAHAQSIVFDLQTSSMTLPSVIVGANNFKVVLRYDADGRLSITSATPVVAAPQIADICTATMITLEKFNAVALGMTVEQVNATIGCKPDPSLTIRNGMYVAYSWSLTTAFRSISVFFDPNGTVVTAFDPRQPNLFKTSNGF